LPPGTDGLIFKIFSPKYLAFLVQNTAKFCKNSIVTLIFKQKANFLLKAAKIAENL
jgi:hypothetical protein